MEKKTRHDIPGCDPVVLYEYECTDSTNRVLLDMAREGCPSGTVVWAHRQESGRGRLGRSFSSPEGGIYISLLLPLEKDGICLTAMTGVAVKRTISEVCNKDCGIKWVNDIIYKGKKVCGILAQATSGKVVMGIGINYTTDMLQLPEDVREIATSLYSSAADAPPMEVFVNRLVYNIYSLYYGRDENWLEDYKSSSTIVGNKVKIMQAGKVTGEGTAVSIDDSCFLHVVDMDGKETVLSTGEVSIRIQR
ncbi:MAG TPA: biotin--[acetyl-CoA-carboxylase] ligase [Sphaerochaeta sp.]|nr:biotin--[acetyl-CoA-carboxylase] ligase [Sphaerochaeta sp.]